MGVTRALVVLLVLAAWCSRARRFRAPHGWYIGGAQPSGSFRLDPVLGWPANDLVDARARRNLAGPEPVLGQLWCTDGARQDGLSVWCLEPPP